MLTSAAHPRASLTARGRCARFLFVIWTCARGRNLVGIGLRELNMGGHVCESRAMLVSRGRRAREGSIGSINIPRRRRRMRQRAAWGRDVEPTKWSCSRALGVPVGVTNRDDDFFVPMYSASYWTETYHFWARPGEMAVCRSQFAVPSAIPLLETHERSCDIPTISRGCGQGPVENALICSNYASAKQTR